MNEGDRYGRHHTVQPGIQSGHEPGQKAAQRGPVFITDRGRPAHVLLSIEEYQKLAGRSKTLAEALHMPGAAEVQFNPPKADWMPKPAEFD